ncbi:uncharacterized protein M421DRAFT_421334 [Didymella exigua CBS 183.55]|uniref:Uncharacterized protein n=1 Tax=Didymella exigua CBS 183.55 TaxID=1150837 RepID=A0A6A5RK14_9PLEO|nr:uncharacterized protein M421DRAFT_421334 [Didymella exigua CBS 183.55]KAF1928152.1 hypothetical protein M421DRAFT_421334 [Didymella exigua CBS 183.55]
MNAKISGPMNMSTGIAKEMMGPQPDPSCPLPFFSPALQDSLHLRACDYSDPQQKPYVGHRTKVRNEEGEI